ncbi:Serine/threonine-protein kinase 4, partial [Irineochytrium annulatum]
MPPTTNPADAVVARPTAAPSATASASGTGGGDPGLDLKAVSSGGFNWFGGDKTDPKEIFDIKEKLGEGAFGSVYRAVLIKTGLVLAVKEILIGKLSDRDTIEKEIDMLRQCRHINTV